MRAKNQSFKTLVLLFWIGPELPDCRIARSAMSHAGAEREADGYRTRRSGPYRGDRHSIRRIVFKYSFSLSLSLSLSVSLGRVSISRSITFGTGQWRRCMQMTPSLSLCLVSVFLSFFLSFFPFPAVC